MKKITVFAALFTLLSFASKAQCDKTMKWISSKSEYINASGNLDHAADETVEVTANKTKVSIELKSPHEDSMNGDVTDYTCNWKDTKNGKITFKSALVDPHGDTRHATITIETIDGKTTILLDAEEESMKIKLNADSGQEVK